MALTRFFYILLITSVYLSITPYTKVEESFNIQAIHDFIYFRSSFGSQRISKIFVHNDSQTSVNSVPRLRWDHEDFPGPIPRTFLGALIIGLITPSWFEDKFIVQVSARLILALFFSSAFSVFVHSVERKFGTSTANLLLLSTASQFHVFFYASRSLPNTFAFILVLFALSAWLSKRFDFFPILVAATVVVFRFETCLLFGPIILYEIFITRDLDIISLLKYGVPSGLIFLTITVVFDSKLWDLVVYPEGYSVYFNVFLNKSKDWGTQPFLWYFYSALPRALLSTLIFLTVCKRSAFPILWVSLVFVTLYSFLPHKELRFILYSIPLFNTCAASGMSELLENFYFKKIYLTNILPNRIQSLLKTYFHPGKLSESDSLKPTLRNSHDKSETSLKLRKTESYNQTSAKVNRESPNHPTIATSTKIASCMILLLIFGHVFFNLTITLYATLISYYNYPGGHAIRWINEEILVSDSKIHPHKIGVYVSNLAAQTGFTRFLQLNDVFYDKSSNFTSLLHHGQFHVAYFILEDSSTDFIQSQCTYSNFIAKFSDETRNLWFECAQSSVFKKCKLTKIFEAFDRTNLSFRINQIQIKLKSVLWIYKCLMN